MRQLSHYFFGYLSLKCLSSLLITEIMVEIAQDKGFFLLKFSEQEANALGIDKNSIYELLKAKNNLWVMTETEKKSRRKKERKWRFIKSIQGTLRRIRKV